MAWRLVLMALLGWALVACAAPSPNRPRTESIEGIQHNYRKKVMSVAMNEFAQRFGAAVERASDTIAAGTESRVIQQRALVWKMNAIQQARVACFRLDPLAAQFDMWTLVIQMEAFFTTGEGAEIFGDQQHIAVETSASLLEDIRAIAQQSTGSAEDLARIESEQIQTWADANPIRSLEFHRPSSIGRYASLVREQGNTFAQFASIEENLSQLLYMLRITLSDLPRQARWQSELVLARTLDGAEVDDAIESINRIAASAEIGASFAEDVPRLVQTEREALMSGLDAERELFLQDVERIRIQSLEQISIEREIVVNSIEKNLEAVLATVRSERARIVEDLDQIVARSIEDAITGGSAEATAVGERVVGLFTIRIVILVLAGIVLAPIVARVYLRVWPRGV